MMFISWILSLMILLQPNAPWKSDYENIATGIEQGAKRVPVFQGDSAVKMTIALDVSLAWYESRYDRHAVGDHGTAHGLYQVHAPEDETIEEQTVNANLLLKHSFKVCIANPLNERLAWYASGKGDGCENEGGRKASRHRMATAMWLFRK